MHTRASLTFSEVQIVKKQYKVKLLTDASGYGDYQVDLDNH